MSGACLNEVLFEGRRRCHQANLGFLDLAPKLWFAVEIMSLTLVLLANRGSLVLFDYILGYSTFYPMFYLTTSTMTAGLGLRTNALTVLWQSLFKWLRAIGPTGIAFKNLN